MQTQTDWEAAYRRGETPWEKGTAHPALLDFVRQNDPLAGEILVPGCGFGHDVRALSTATNHVVGIDLAPLAIEKARMFPRVANEEYLLADFFSLGADAGRTFDVVFEHTCFCAIDPTLRAKYVESVVRLSRPGGRFIAIFFLNPDHDEEGPPFGVARDELEKFFRPRFSLEREWIPARTYPGRENRELMQILVRRDV